MFTWVCVTVSGGLFSDVILLNLYSNAPAQQF